VRLTVSASTYIKAPRRVVYSALTAYRHYEAWVPDIVRSRLFAREGELAIAEFISPPYGRGKLVLEFVESAPTSVVFTQVDRFRQDGLFGQFELTAAKHDSGTLVKALLGSRVGVLRLLGCRRRLRVVLERTMTALTSRALKLLTSGLSDVPDQRAKVLELEIGGHEVSLRVGGTTYELVRRDVETPS
jgi:uncharacterized protein YndB with AHSA1/START domain